MACFSSFLLAVYLASFFGFAFAAPVEKRVLTLAHRDLVDLSTRQSKMAGKFTLPPLPYDYDVSIIATVPVLHYSCLVQNIVANRRRPWSP